MAKREDSGHSFLAYFKRATSPLAVSASEIVDGRARNYYAVTAAGREYLRQTLAEYDEISGVFRQLMEGWDG